MLRGKAVKKSIKVPSPYQGNLGTGIDSVMKLVGELSLLKEQLISQVDSKLEEVDETMSTMEEKVGELDDKVSQVKTLNKGDAGADADEQKIADYVLSSIRGWVLNQIVPQIRQPRDGYSPDPEEIARKALAYIRQPNEDEIFRRLAKRLPKPSIKVVKESINIENLIKDILNSDKFKTYQEEGLEQTRQALRSQVKKDIGYVHGGGDTVSAGTNITITSVNGTKQISSIGAAFTSVAVTPTPDDTTLIYTAASSISAVVINGSTYINGSSAMGGTISISGTTVTLPSPVGTGGDIYGIS